MPFLSLETAPNDRLSCSVNGAFWKSVDTNTRYLMNIRVIANARLLV